MSKLGAGHARPHESAFLPPPSRRGSDVRPEETTLLSNTDPAADEHAEGTRRDFLYYATAGAGVVITGAAV